MGQSIEQRRAKKAKLDRQAQKQKREERAMFAQYIRRKDAERSYLTEADTAAIAAWLKRRASVT